MKNRRTFIILVGLAILLFLAYRISLAPTPPVTENPDTPVSGGNPTVDEPKKDQTPLTVEPTTFHLYFPYDTGTDFAIKEFTAVVTLEESETPLDRIVDMLKAPTSDGAEQLVPVLGPDANILSVEVMENDILKVNVNREFISQMNAGSALEGQIIKCFVKSLAELYQAKGILIRVDGELYESGHYFFAEDEVLYAE